MSRLTYTVHYRNPHTPPDTFVGIRESAKPEISTYLKIDLADPVPTGYKKNPANFVLIPWAAVQKIEVHA